MHVQRFHTKRARTNWVDGEKCLASGFKEVFRQVELILTIPGNAVSKERTFYAKKPISLLSVGGGGLLMQLKQSSLLHDEIIEQFLNPALNSHNL